MARQPYPSDLTDLEWEIIEPLLPPPINRGKPRTTNMREYEELPETSECFISPTITSYGLIPSQIRRSL